MKYDKHIASFSVAGPCNFYLFGAAALIKSGIPKIDMPVIVHCDKYNAELLDKILTAENIDKSNITIQVHTGNPKCCLHWRLQPVNDTFSHILDTDDELSDIQAYCINDFKKLDYDWYTIRLNKQNKSVTLSCSGFNPVMLGRIYISSIYNGKAKNYAYSYDEDISTYFGNKYSDTGIVYITRKATSKPKYTIVNTKFISDKECINDHRGWHPNFSCLSNYDNGIYTLESTKIKVANKKRIM